MKGKLSSRSIIDQYEALAVMEMHNILNNEGELWTLILSNGE